PPSGIPQNWGITVNAQFSQDNFQTIATQPAFYYQNFDDQVKGNNEWFYPTSNYNWKVRFAPTKTGTWQYRVVAQDGSGTVTSAAQTFNVINSSSHGFVRVSKTDPRYFEFDDGTYFPNLGINSGYNEISWKNPT